MKKNVFIIVLTAFVSFLSIVMAFQLLLSNYQTSSDSTPPKYQSTFQTLNFKRKFSRYTPEYILHLLHFYKIEGSKGEIYPEGTKILTVTPTPSPLPKNVQLIFAGDQSEFVRVLIC